MKKTILFIGLFILTLPMFFTSCNDDDVENVILTNNIITIGDAISPITSVSSKIENGNTYIVVNTNAMQSIFEFDEKQNIPTGSFQLTFNGDCNGEITMAWSGAEYVLTGDLDISISDDIYTISAVGNAFLDYYTFVPFTLYYNGKIK